MMKKFAIGCGVLILLIGIALGGVAFYTYRQAKMMFSQFAEFGQIPEIERSVRVKAAYTPPSSEELTAGQIERLMKVQSAVRQRLGERFLFLEQKYKALTDKKDHTIADAPALLAAYRDVASAWMEAKRTQVAALNDAGLSLDEYRWIRDQVYRALGVPFMDFDVSKIVEQIRSGATSQEPGQIRGSVGPSGPESNRKLIEPFKKQLEENLPLASFGL
jgi:hypothetical protein